MSDRIVAVGRRRTLAAGVGCCALLVVGPVVSGQTAPPSADSFTLNQPLYLQATTESATEPTTEPTPSGPRRPLMYLLDKMGIAKTLDNLGIDIRGHIQGSWTYSDSSPPNNDIQGRVFDVDNQDPTLNQIGLSVTRDVSNSVKDKKFDVGFTLDTIYGGDARFIHANGANFYGSASPQLDPDEQFDIVQLYADFSIPLGNGLLLRAGKFTSPFGYEQINPTGNPLFSHSFLFGFATPFTQTGVMAFYNLTDKLSIAAGITRGWNQALKDNNGDAIDFISQVTYKLSEKTNVIFGASIGPEGPGDPGNWWWLADLVITHQMTDKLSVALNGDYGWYPHGAAGGSAAMWYGIAGYAGYKINDVFTINGRLEWYNDPDGFTVAGFPNTYYGATLGVAIKPMPNDDIGRNLLIRPEVRYDYADNAFFDRGTDHDQFTLGVDAIFTF